MQLSLEQIRDLGAIERAMDDGTQAFVVCDGGRWAFPQELLAHLGIVSGQTVSGILLAEVMRANLLHVARQVEATGG